MMKNVIPMKFFNSQNIHKMASLKISVLEDFNSDQLEMRIELKHPIKLFLALWQFVTRTTPQVPAPPDVMETKTGSYTGSSHFNILK